MDTIARHQAAPFAWGRYDCATLFGDVVEAVTGGNPIARHGPWFSARMALKQLRLAGAQDARSFVAMHLPRVDASAARRGDVGYPAGAIAALQMPAVVVGAEAVSRDERGWIVFPRSLLVECFAVGTDSTSRLMAAPGAVSAPEGAR